VVVDSVEPPGTEVAVELRLATQALGESPWQKAVPGLTYPVTVTAPCSLQYRLRLSSRDPAVSPIVEELRLEWNDPLAPPVRGGRGRVRP
jgi:hypothetical protein